MKERTDLVAALASLDSDNLTHSLFCDEKGRVRGSGEGHAPGIPRHNILGEGERDCQKSLCARYGETFELRASLMRGALF